MPEQECQRYVLVDQTTWEDVSSGDDPDTLQRQAEELNKQLLEPRYFVRDRDQRKRVTPK